LHARTLERQGATEPSQTSPDDGNLCHLFPDLLRCMATCREMLLTEQLDNPAHFEKRDFPSRRKVSIESGRRLREPQIPLLPRISCKAWWR
jgi:hypothetical protein